MAILINIEIQEYHVYISKGEGYMDVYPKSKFSSKSNLKFGATKHCMNVVLKIFQW